MMRKWEAMSETLTQVTSDGPTGQPWDKLVQAQLRRKAAIARIVDLGIVIALFILIIIGVSAVPGFGSEANIRAILADSAFLGIVAVGMTFVVVSGNYLDLSVVAQIATAAVIVTVLQPVNLWLGVLVALAATLVFAAFNTLGVGVMKANGVVVTLAVQTAGLGLLFSITGGAQFNGSSEWLNHVATTALGPVPLVFLVMVVIGVIGEIILFRTNLGLSIRAVGSSKQAAQISGVGRSRAVFAAFAIVSTCCAIAGILLAGFNNNAIGSIGSGFDFNSLAAVIIGGTSLFGGRGSALRTLVGVLFVGVLLNISVLLGLPFEWQQFMKGLIIVVAVAGDALLRRKGLR
jgi:ribose transport system permease protein